MSIIIIFSAVHKDDDDTANDRDEVRWRNRRGHGFTYTGILDADPRVVLASVW